jgi:uncharacterized protein YndB with AHSA1/START domain
VSETTTELVGERELLMSRTFDAPRALVFEAWTRPEHLARWWGPTGWTLPVCNLDLRPGGVWHYCMRGPGGEEGWGRAEYLEIVEPERLVFRDAFSDADGNIVDAMPVATVTVTFEERGRQTVVTSRTRYETSADRDRVVEMGVVEGMTQTLDRLEELLGELQRTEQGRS